MELFKKKMRLEKFIKCISMSAIFFFMHNHVVLGTENKLNIADKNQKEYKFEEIYFLNSVPYIEYDNSENQVNNFFGLNSVESSIINYPDFYIIRDSDNLRKIYEYAINHQPYSFLTVNVRAEPRKVFMLRFERYLNIEDVE